MNAETKRHIDAARQVLVGVVPNPASQIDQITNALIYKFMDDMDQSAIKQGGEPSFFTGGLKDYAWTRLMDTRIGNQERMNIYSEALVKFSESRQLPQLFREIFKSAFLPYRSPEVLGLFLKEIDYFDYSHPEELGNAYEYLLSIMSSQGDAGQFRTPRHIIDFIVDVINPTVEDKVLDPACGTGGFLVSAYKHIAEQHDGKNSDGTKNKEKPLTPDQRKNLMSNFEGYDIDPGMVRIAQVNMYLHQFKNPKIYNYDSLSMEERWNDKFDVILANPPFMSPKGGVSTHNKFSINATRSEVLFVDYIMNHLRPKGRAGVIVPEGIIFQSGTSHKQLRKNLVNDGLYAVVSLPAGVFQPYSGVKTSILLFNNELAKQSKEILFVKVENDGLELSAQRRASTKNDLPEALEILNKWSIGIKVESVKAVYVEKIKIAESGDYNLSGDRYRTVTDYSDTEWSMVELGDICKVLNGYAFKSSQFNDQKIGTPLIRIRDVNTGFSETYYNGEYDEKYTVNDGDLLIGMDGDFVATIWRHGKALLNQRVCRLEKFNNANKKYIYYLLQKELDSIHENTYAVTVKHLSSSQIEKIKIPLPPLEVQEQIVAELDGYQNIITGAKQVTNNWKPVIDIDSTWEKVKLSMVCEKITDGSHNPPKEQAGGGYFMLSSQNVFNGHITTDKAREMTKEDFMSEDRRTNVKVGDVLLTIVGTIGRTAVVTNDLPYRITLQRSVAVLKPEIKILVPEFLSFMLRTDELHNELINKSAGVAQKGIYLKQLGEIEIPFPPIEIQKQIVERIEAERVLVEGNKKLIKIYEQKTKDVLARLWED